MKNYRILKDNEIVRKGDQWYRPSTRGWRNVWEPYCFGVQGAKVRRPTKG